MSYFFVHPERAVVVQLILPSLCLLVLPVRGFGVDVSLYYVGFWAMCTNILKGRIWYRISKCCVVSEELQGRKLTATKSLEWLLN
jgi:hypothetical protein